MPSFGILIIAFQVFGLGDTPVVIALVALAIPPMVTNSYVGLAEVDKDVRDAARGMGYRELAQLMRIELPLAVPLVMAGIRTSALGVVATATLASWTGYDTLGAPINVGIAVRDNVQVFAGAVIVAALALAVEIGLAGAQRLLVSPGLRSEGRARAGWGRAR